jgi:hypothetical protein
VYGVASPKHPQVLFFFVPFVFFVFFVAESLLELEEGPVAAKQPKVRSGHCSSGAATQRKVGWPQGTQRAQGKEL